MRACPHCTEKSGRQLDRFCSKVAGMCEGAAYGKAVPSRPFHLRSASKRQSLNCFAKKLKVRSFKVSAHDGRVRAACGRRAGGVRCVCDAGARGVGRLRCRTVYAEHKSKAAVRQPCLLSIFDNLKHIQSGFFWFLGFFFPKKNPKWGLGQSLIYTSPPWGRPTPRISVFPALLRYPPVQRTARRTAQ